MVWEAGLRSDAALQCRGEVTPRRVRGTYMGVLYGSVYIGLFRSYTWLRSGYIGLRVCKN